MSDSTTPRLGQLLLQAGLIDAATLQDVLLVQRADGRRLGELLVERGVVHPHQLAQVLSHQLACPWVSLTNLLLTPSLLELLPRDVALRWNVVPVYLRTAKVKSALYIAIDDPTDEVALSAIAAAVDMAVKPMVAAAGEIDAALVAYYGAEPKHPRPKPTPTASRAEPAAASESTAKPTAIKPAKLPAPAAALTPRPGRVAPSPAVTIVPEAEEEADIIAEASAPTTSRSEPVALVIQAPNSFTDVCRQAATAVGARVEVADLMMTSAFVSVHAPFAIVVTDDIYSFDRHGLNGLALDSDAVLVVWSEDLEARQLEPLLKGALRRHRS